jgi:hypothetical protein
MKGVNRIVAIVDLLAPVWRRLARQEGETMGDFAAVLAVFALPTFIAFVAIAGGLTNAVGLVQTLFRAIFG